MSSDMDANQPTIMTNRQLKLVHHPGFKKLTINQQGCLLSQEVGQLMECRANMIQEWCAVPGKIEVQKGIRDANIWTDEARAMAANSEIEKLNKRLEVLGDEMTPVWQRLKDIFQCDFHFIEDAFV